MNRRCIKWHDKWFSFDSLPISSWKPEIRQTSHKLLWYKSPWNTSLRRNNLNKIRGCHKKKNTYLIEQVLFFWCGKSRIRQQRIFYWWILCPRRNSLTNTCSSFMFKKFLALHANEFGSVWEEQNVLATHKKNQIACSKSNSLSFLL